MHCYHALGLTLSMEVKHITAGRNVLHDNDVLNILELINAKIVLTVESRQAQVIRNRPYLVFPIVTYYSRRDDSSIDECLYEHLRLFKTQHPRMKPPDIKHILYDINGGYTPPTSKKQSPRTPGHHSVLLPEK